MHIFSKNFHSRNFTKEVACIIQVAATLIILMLFTANGLSQTFTEVSATLVGIQYGGSVAWGDYDDDNDLDILLVGRGSASEPYVAKLYRNDGGRFVEVTVPFSPVYNSSVAWGDYDNDGDLDVLLTGGANVGSVTKVYRNEKGNFVDISAALPGTFGSWVEWGDFDNDGDLDILLTGAVSDTNVVARIYRNQQGLFEDISAGLQGVGGLCSATWGDYDNDGDLDILITGSTRRGSITKIYRNDDGRFIDVNAPLLALDEGNAVWGDFDNDGDQDILLTGFTGSNNVTKVYRNDAGNFVDILAGVLIGARSSRAAWGDFDNNGFLDILLTGFNLGSVTKIYKNQDGHFQDINAQLVQVSSGAVATGDFDKDGDLDILLVGSSTGGPVAKVYQNNSTIANTVPITPQNLAATVSGNTVILRWSKSLDNQTAQDALSYNLRVGITPGGSEIVSPMANPTTGYRKIPKIGNTNNRNSWTLKNLPVGKYYWSVQAIDHAYAGSTFAPEQAFRIGNQLPTVANPIMDMTLTIGAASFTRNLNLVFTDADGDALSFAANSSSPNIADASISNNIITITPKAAGITTISVQATDGFSNPITVSFVVSVNRPPVVANAISNQKIDVDGEPRVINLDSAPAVFTDPDGDRLSYTASSSNTNVATAMIATSSLIISPKALGNSSITVTADDNKGGIKSASFAVIVDVPNYPSTLPLLHSIEFPSHPKASEFQVTDYQIVGLPGASELGINEVLAGSHRINWQAYWDDGSVDSPDKFLIEFNGSPIFRFSAGRAFWIIRKGNLEINTTVNPAPLNNNSEAEIVDLHSGWNLITNPFWKAIYWPAVMSYNNVNNPNPIWEYKGVSGFSKSDSLKPYVGYYWNNSDGIDTIRVPYRFLFPSSASNVKVEDMVWKVNINLILGAYSDNVTAFGVSVDASRGFDKFDYSKPRMLTTVLPQVYFERPKWSSTYTSFATDIRPEFEEQESWDFDVQSEQGEPVKLTFSGINRIPSHFAVYLIDPARASSLNLREDSLYNFTPATDITKFTVRVGKAEALQEDLDALIPRKFALEQNFPNPFNPTTAIPITVPTTTEVKLKIYNLLGKEVKTLYSGRLDPGRHFFNWDGRDEIGNALGTGVYFYRVTTNTGFTFTKKMLLVK
ncbi:FG-GAP-like repeat-containing protein [candidate division KSB1 bacterium]|nr:FG-GAP-like repeat-containing protein [candidate division KSB1 bacterium]